MATKTVQTSGGDYTTLQAWEDALPATLTENEVVQLADQVYSAPTGLAILTVNVATSTFTITIECQTGASWREQSGVASNKLQYPSSGARIESTGTRTDTGRLIDMRCDAYIIKGLALKCDYSGSYGGAIINEETYGFNDSRMENCLFELTTNATKGISITGENSEIVNCIVIDRSTSGLSNAVSLRDGGDLINCTIVRPSNLTSGGTGIRRSYGTAIVKNTALFGFATALSGTISTSSDYNATDLTAPTNWGTNSTGSLTYADQFEQTSDASTLHDFRLKAASDLEGAATRDATNTADLDIIGQSRDTVTPDIGCWEYTTGGGGISIPLVMIHFMNQGIR